MEFLGYEESINNISVSYILTVYDFFTLLS